MRYFLLIFLAAFYICVAGCAQAGAGGVKMAASDMQSLAIENLDLSAQEFWKTYRSKDISERRLAEMYLIGVLDSGEGRMWCGYNIALPHSILDQVHIGFKKASEEMMAGRASDVINHVMSNVLPCKEEE